MSKPPTIREVARRAGVSVATVSRVMNGRGSVSERTRRTVGEAIRDTGFRPNVIGRGLKTARSGTLGVLVPSLRNPIFADAVHGIERAAEAGGYRILLTSSNYLPGKEVAAIDVLLCNRVEGLVLTVADESSSQALEILDRSNVPFVLVFNPAGCAKHSVVTIDNFAAARDIVSRLVRMGHRRIAMIAGDSEASDRSNLRRAGYERALADAGLRPGPIIEVSFDSRGLERHCRALLSCDPAPTALFCSTDMLAIGAIRGFAALGLKVPDDVSVVGFDGIEVGRCMSPSLATVVQPAEDMGARAVEHLLERLNAGAPATNLTLPYRLRHGESWARQAREDDRTERDSGAATKGTIRL